MGDAGFPANAAARDRFVLDHRGPRPHHDPWIHQGLIVEHERTADGASACVATVLLTGRECPWRCTMCDLWRYTTKSDTPSGAIPAQIATALSAADGAVPFSVVKLYNAGSFFDPRAVPESDYDAVADALVGISRVIVESHPSLAGARVDRFLTALQRHDGSARTELEVAMGLETVHPDALERLNKRITLADFEGAARTLADRGVALRVFLLISPPFVPPSEQDAWMLRSLDAAFSCGATAVSLVPTRSGNGAMDALAAAGAFQAPDLDDIERTYDLALLNHRDRGRIFVDLWDLDRFGGCPACFDARRTRLAAMNDEQRILPRVSCPAGASHAGA
jgi:radical SAM enzyme (TIGR01210 family)